MADSNPAPGPLVETAVQPFGCRFRGIASGCRCASARYRVNAEPASDVKGIVERLEADLDAVAGGFGGRHVDVAAQGGAQGIGYQLDRRGLVGMEGGAGTGTA